MMILKNIGHYAYKMRLHILFALIFLYFLYHLIIGGRGIIALYEVEEKIHHLTEELEEERAKRLHIEHKVSLLHPGSLDLDLLDEQARNILGYANKDEIVILFDK